MHPCIGEGRAACFLQIKPEKDPPMPSKMSCVLEMERPEGDLGGLVVKVLLCQQNSLSTVFKTFLKVGGIRCKGRRD